MNGLSFSQLSEDQLRAATDQIILKGAALCGCPTPMTEGFAEIIATEITVFIKEYGYENLTLSEVLAALRLNAAAEWRWPSGDLIDRIEFSGNCFNVGYLAKILHPYRVIRHNMDRRFQNKLDGHE